MDTYNEKYEKYNSLIVDLKNMIDNKGRGFEVAQALNDELWEDMSTHKNRMEEQVSKMKNARTDQELQMEMKTADSIYEATRSYMSKHK